MQVPHYAKECIADPAVIARLISLKLAIKSANGCAAPLAWIPLVGSRWLGGCAVRTYIIAGEVAEIFCRRCNRSSIHLNRTPEYSVHCSKRISKDGPRETQLISYGA